MAGWACTIAITCSEFHEWREKSRRLGWVALAYGPVSMCGRACVMMMMFIGTETLVTQHAGEREASGAYADAQVLQHAVIPLGAARINPRGVGDSVKFDQSCGQSVS